MPPYIIWSDQTGENPLAPATVVSVYPSDLPICPATLIVQGMAEPGGKFDTLGLLALGTDYVATFFGVEAPALNQSFTTSVTSGDDTPVTIDQYRSPYFSAAGYRDDIIAKQPNGWYATSAPNLINIATAIGATFGLLSTKAQQLRAYQRMQGCTGNALDSWVRDYFGNNLPRYPLETDAEYRTRIIFWLGNDHITLAAVTRAMQFFFSLTYPGKTITLNVYDRMSKPNWAIGIGIKEPTFVAESFETITRSVMFYTDYAYTDIDHAVPPEQFPSELGLWTDVSHTDFMGHVFTPTVSEYAPLQFYRDPSVDHVLSTTLQSFHAAGTVPLVERVFSFVDTPGIANAPTPALPGIALDVSGSVDLGYVDTPPSP